MEHNNLPKDLLENLKNQLFREIDQYKEIEKGRRLIRQIESEIEEVNLKCCVIDRFDFKNRALTYTSGLFRSLPKEMVEVGLRSEDQIPPTLKRRVQLNEMREKARIEREAMQENGRKKFQTENNN